MEYICWFWSESRMKLKWVVLCVCRLRCKNMEVPIEKIYNKTQREKFAWAIDMTEADFEF